ncbi:hypothetical protein EVG20_g8020 [Dentipellis fragilis]|uniref:Uncharacterized protein n=1 Tax=Dentipellis fragilis TaxID=205917 RepID=A0A4Y9YA63_9AGAM|nr:hypothetical protein EVG20_g8020 [Dentipellis fragilis]
MARAETFANCGARLGDDALHHSRVLSHSSLQLYLWAREHHLNYLRLCDALSVNDATPSIAWHEIGKSSLCIRLALLLEAWPAATLPTPTLGLSQSPSLSTYCRELGGIARMGNRGERGTSFARAYISKLSFRPEPVAFFWNVYMSSPHVFHPFLPWAKPSASEPPITTVPSAPCATLLASDPVAVVG